MLTSTTEVISAIKRYGDYYQPRTASVISLVNPTGGFSVDTQPFAPGFLDNIDARLELSHRWRRLTQRQRDLLYLWYCLTLPVTEISRKLGLSRMHCYRLKNAAIKEIIAMGEDQKHVSAEPGPRDGHG